MVSYEQMQPMMLRLPVGYKIIKIVAHVETDGDGPLEVIDWTFTAKDVEPAPPRDWAVLLKDLQRKYRDVCEELAQNKQLLKKANESNYVLMRQADTHKE